jgi:4-amino-4-deoxy-L-arabinose transferase-like glycosyltransferase
MSRGKEMRPFPFYALSFLLILCLFLQCYRAMQKKSPTYDEVVHAPAGLTEILTGSHRLVNDHPPLFRYFLALPLFAYHPAVPFYSQAWKEKNPWDRRYDFGKFFYFRCGNDADRLLNSSRLVAVLFSVLLAALVLSFSARLFGRAAGLFSLFLYVFDPNIIAHSMNVKNDIFVTVFIFMTFYQLYRYFQSGRVKDLLLTGLCFGFAISTKYSSFMILGIMLILFARHLAAKGGGFLKSILRSLGHTLFIAVVGVCVLFAAYNLFAFNAKHFKKTFGDADNVVKEYTVLENAGNLYKGITGGMKHLEDGHGGYFMGGHSKKGWLSYFPVAFLIKNPIPLLVFFLFSLALFFLFYKDLKRVNIFFLTIIGAFFILLMLSSLDLGYRYLLPVHPFLAVYCGVLVQYLAEKKNRAALAAACILMAWYAGGTVSISPHYLAYFNELIGGPDNGSRYLVDSNLDWGQDLKGLKEYMGRNSIPWIYLVYFGSDDPAYRGIRYSPDMKDEKFLYRPADDTEKAFEIGINAFASQKPGYYAVSATYLRGLYFNEEQRDFFKSLRDKKPVAKIGYSIFIYKIEQ